MILKLLRLLAHQKETTYKKTKNILPKISSKNIIVRNQEKAKQSAGRQPNQPCQQKAKEQNTVPNIHPQTTVLVVVPVVHVDSTHSVPTGVSSTKPSTQQGVPTGVPSTNQAQ